MKDANENLELGTKVRIDVAGLFPEWYTPIGLPNDTGVVVQVPTKYDNMPEECRKTVQAVWFDGQSSGEAYLFEAENVLEILKD